MTPLIETLYLLSTALMVPVILALLGLLVWSLLEVGGFVREARERRRCGDAWQEFFKESPSPESSPAQREKAAAFFMRSDYPGLVACFAERGRAIQADTLRLAKLVSELEIEAAGRLARMSFGVRVGPILGLMGTLIPMGPALIGLSSGDIDVMARNLVVAFSTTVLGLLVGGICYGIWLVRRQWYARDLSDIEYVYQCIAESGGSADAA